MFEGRIDQSHIRRLSMLEWGPIGVSPFGLIFFMYHQFVSMLVDSFSSGVRGSGVFLKQNTNSAFP
jgi:hypothetical protein